MEENEINYIEDLAKKFRMKVFKPLKFFSKIFNVCYSQEDVSKLLNKAMELKESAQSTIQTLSEEQKILMFNHHTDITKLSSLKTELEDLKVGLNTSNKEKEILENNIVLLKEKHKKEIDKLAKTISNLQYSKCCLEKEVVGLRTDLNECNQKFEDKTKNNNKESGQFMDKLLKKNEKLTNELKEIKEYLKKKKIKIEL